ncbi:hypothetical protein Scep_024056 [Stephania cephalantha]|uniref:Uncharacterized protein n=1 Tax=Stephania cephalantha TaxID=152367 RepID=A0AAP0EVU5_9MAGN
MNFIGLMNSRNNYSTILCSKTLLSFLCMKSNSINYTPSVPLDSWIRTTRQ